MGICMHAQAHINKQYTEQIPTTTKGLTGSHDVQDGTVLGKAANQLASGWSALPLNEKLVWDLPPRQALRAFVPPDIY